MAFSKARRLSDFIAADGTVPATKFATGTITSAMIADTSITPTDLHTSLDLTGKTVTVATASGSTNTTAAASTAFVQQELTTLIGGAPSTLNDLNELAAAINDDANYNSTLTTALATKLPLAGGTMTGGLSIRGFNGPILKLGSSGTADPRIDFEDQNSTNLGAGIFLDQDADTLRILRTVSGSATDGIAINASGNVGIGVAIPLAKLHIVDGNNNARIGDLNGSSTMALQLADSGASPVQLEAHGTSLRINTSTTSGATPTVKMSVLANGNVGIGTTTAHLGQKLTVAGGIAFGTSTSKNIIADFGETNLYLINYNTDSSATIRFHVGGGAASNERLRIDSSGNVGIGTDTPISLDGNAVPGLTIASNGPFICLKDANNADKVNYISNNTGVMQFGFVGDNGTTGKTEVMSLSSVGAVFNENHNADLDFRVESDTNSNAIFVDAFANVVYLGKNTGALADIGYYFNANTGNAEFCGDGSTDTLRINRKNSAGTVVNFWLDTVSKGSISVDSTGIQYNTTSDRRLKKDIETITDGTDKLMAMNPVTHGWKADPEADTVHGFIAQEMMEIIPEAVSGDPEGEEMMSMDYGRITPVIVAALQDALKEIKELKNRIHELENK